MRTYQDAMEYLVDLFDLDRSARHVRLMRRAVDEAYRDLPYRHAWSYYRRREILHTIAPQSTGTIEYVHSTRTVTLTGDTFPTDASAYRLLIGNIAYDIEKYLTSTTVTLPELQNPGEDVAAGTSYTLHRVAYDLPDNFRRMLGVFDPVHQREVISIEDTREQGVRTGVYSRPDTPWWFSIRGTPTGKLQIIFTPSPAFAVAYDLMYIANPRPIGIFEKYSVGTVATSSTAVTGTSTAFPTNCEGAVIRFSANASDEPTGPFGALVNNQSVDNPYADQTVILTRTSGTALVLQDAVSAYSGVKYTISDPLDIEDGAMLTAFLKLCEANMARLIGRESKDRDAREASFKRSLLEAMENDNRRPFSKGQLVYNPYLRLDNQPEI